MPSVTQRAVHTRKAAHDPSVPSIMANSSGAVSSRATVTPLAGVASADGPKLVAIRRGTATRSGPIAPVTDHRRERSDRELLGDLDDAVDLRGLAVAPPDARPVDKHLELLTDEVVRGDAP